MLKQGVHLSLASQCKHLNIVIFSCCFHTEALSTVDIPKLQPKVVDVIPPEVFEDMSISQLQVKSLVLPSLLTLSHCR